MGSRLAVIIVADIVGYSGMMARDEAAGIAAVREINDTKLVPICNRHAGEILKRLGDGWILAFGSITMALDCATELQAELAKHPMIKLRIGGHLGEITEDEDEFYGAGINLAARLEAEAPPGGIMISQDLFRQLTGSLAAEFESAGSLELKNIPGPIEGFYWSPKKKVTPEEDKRPVIVVEKIEFGPNDEDTKSAALELRDQLLMNLSKRTGIRVVDALTAMTLNPSYYLRGRLRMAAGQARLNVTLVLSETGEPAFSQNYQGATADIFAFFDQTITQVNADIRNHLNNFDAERVKHVPIEEMGISDLLARVASTGQSGKYQEWMEARKYFDRALELSPDHPMVLGMSSMGEILFARAKFQDIGQETADQLENDVNRALVSMPKSDYLFAVRGMCFLFGKRDIESAKRDCLHALKLNPTYYFGRLILSMVEMAEAKFNDALATLEQADGSATEMSYEPMRQVNLAFCLYCSGDYQGCANALETAIQLQPGFWTLHRFKAIVLRNLGNSDAANASDAVADALPKEPTMFFLKPLLGAEHAVLLEALAPTEGF
nr:adenylate/guanylate cyclase domain-containing protein [Ruegeria sp. R13_0]